MRLAMSRKATAASVLLAAATIAACGDGRSLSSPPAAPSSSGLSGMMPWSDEFEGGSGSAPNPRLWTYDLGNNNGWGNNELQTYTAENAYLDGAGHLIIRVESTSTGFTSARLKTRGLALAQYGQLEARIQVPDGRGLWPAFWMLGHTFTGSNWPECGEIDVMEHVGREPFSVYAAVHGPGYSAGRAVSASYTAASRLATDYHVFAIDWTPSSIVFSIDGHAYHTVTPQSLPTGTAWVFDQPFFVLLNVAVAGTFAGPLDPTIRLPQEMRVDYVRYRPRPPRAEN